MKFNIEDFLSTHDTPFYLFDEDAFVRNIKALQSVFQGVYPNYRVAYSFKTNYAPFICSMAKRNGCYAEVVSDMEYMLAKKLGYSDDCIIYNGPYKGARLEEHLLGGGILNIDSYEETQRVVRLADSCRDREFRVGLRLSMDIGAGFISRFGMEEGGLDLRKSVELIRSRDNLRIAGLHCHIKAPRDPESWKRRAEILINAADKYVAGTPWYISLGSGMVPGRYDQMAGEHEEYKPSYADFADAFLKPFAAHYQGDGPLVFTEPGRALITRYVSLYAKVDNIKTIQERNLATTNASFQNMGEMCTMARVPVTVFHKSGGEYYDNIDIMGYTCLEQDVMLPSYVGELAPGDYICFNNVGGYSIVYKPQFMTPQCPMYSVDAEGGVKTIMRAETFDDVFSKFIF